MAVTIQATRMGVRPKNWVRLGGWFALSYAGYWLARLFDDLLLRLALYPHLGAPVTDWRFTAFRAIINNGDPGTLTLPPWASAALPLLLQVGFLAFLFLLGTRVGPSSTRIALHYAGLWTVLLMATQVATFGLLGRGRLATLVAAAGWPAPAAAQWLLAVVCAVALVMVAIRCVSPLASSFAELSLDGRPTRGWFLLVLVVSVLFVVAGTLGFRIRFLGTRWLISFLIPVAACLLVGILALRRIRRSSPGDIRLRFSPLSLPGATVAVAGALILGYSLENANRIEAHLLERRLSLISTRHYEFWYDPTPFSEAKVRKMASSREQIFAHLASRLRFADDSLQPVTADDVRIRVVLYPDFVSKRLATSSDRAYTVQGATVRALVAGSIQTIDPAADAAAFLHAVWGPAGNAVVGPWVARLLAGEWRGRTVEEWTAQIEFESGHYPLQELLTAEADHFVSPLVQEPLGAAWVALIYQRHGLDAVRRLYLMRTQHVDLAAVSSILAIPAQQVEGDWNAWTLELVRKYPVPTQTQRPLPTEFLRGITFSHEGWGGRRGGYVDPMATVQLRAIRSVGANTIAVVPYVLMRDRTLPAISTSFTDETDEELTHALHAAHELGLKVMLKPQIWVSFGEFTGRIQFDDPVKRAEWMRNYRELALHYARLAELEGFDLFCIGNELEGMTSHEAEWRHLVADVRRVYHGPITYASNWGAEFESLRWWDAVDYVGLNNYYPLTPRLSERKSDAHLNALDGARAVALKLDAFHAKWRKPILFTEVGYPSVRGGTAEPWIEQASRGVAPAEQAAGYQAIFEVFASRTWLRGMFWWKWPSHGRGAGLEDHSFNPLGKPAEQVLRTWYTRMSNGAPGQPAAAP